MPQVRNPVPAGTYLWNTAHSVYAGCPVVQSGTTDEIDLPAGTSADRIVGIALEDAGPAALAQAATQQVIAVQELGIARCYAKGAITAGNVVKVGTTISVTPAGYSAAVTMQTVSAATQAAAGAQPAPVVGIAQNTTANDGDIVYVRLQPGMFF